MYKGTDPVRGTGYALRVAVKALTAMKNFEAVFVSAIARESIAGHLQPNARDVAAHWRARVPADWVEGVKPLGAKKIMDAARSMIGAILTPALNAQGLSVDDLAEPISCLAAIEALAAALPRPEPPENWERRLADAPDEETTGLGPGSMTPPLVPTASGEIDFSGKEEKAELPQFSEIADELMDLPTDAIESLEAAPPEPVTPTPYAGDYEAPAPVPIDRRPTEPSHDPEDDEPVPDELKKAPVPAEYADLYEPPGPDAGSETGKT